MKNLEDKLYARARGSLMWAITLSIGLVGSVPMIVFGFLLRGGFIALAVLGIICAIGGFYAGPLVWVYFGTLKYYTNVKRQIVSENIRSVNMLAELHNKNIKIMANDVKTMVQNNYLPGFIVLDNERIVDRLSMKQRDYEELEAERAGDLNLVHCPFCNAKFAMILDVGECPYCKSHVTKEMLQAGSRVYNKPNNGTVTDNSDAVTSEKQVK